MNGKNLVVLIGRLTKDPELMKTTAGNSVCSFHIAVERAGKEKKTDFIPVKVWNKTAENLCTHCYKGMLVSVTGELHIDSYQGKDGKTAYSTEVLGESIIYLDKKKDNAQPTYPQGQYPNQQPVPANQNQQAPTTTQQPYYYENEAPRNQGNQGYAAPNGNNQNGGYQTAPQQGQYQQYGGGYNGNGYGY